MTASQSSGVSRAMRLSRVMPALQTSDVEIAERRLAGRDQLARGLGLRDVGLRAPRRGRLEASICATTSSAASASAR